jgi:hypothetical protein
MRSSNEDDLVKTFENVTGIQPASGERVQCPNCCRLAPVTSRRMGLMFYRCELCLTTGAAPDPTVVPD